MKIFLLGEQVFFLESYFDIILSGSFVQYKVKCFKIDPSTYHVAIIKKIVMRKLVTKGYCLNKKIDNRQLVTFSKFIDFWHHAQEEKKKKEKITSACSLDYGKKEEHSNTSPKFPFDFPIGNYY
jgi:hypothetical protein